MEYSAWDSAGIFLTTNCKLYEALAIFVVAPKNNLQIPQESVVDIHIVKKATVTAGIKNFRTQNCLQIRGLNNLVGNSAGLQPFRVRKFLMPAVRLIAMYISLTSG